VSVTDAHTLCGSGKIVLSFTMKQDEPLYWASRLNVNSSILSINSFDPVLWQTP
jgi:hypothetical protein